MLKWKLHFILVRIFLVVLNENDILFWIFQYYCMWPDRPQYMDLWVTEKNLCGPWRLVFEYPWFRTSGRACVVLSSFNSCQKLTKQKPSRPPHTTQTQTNSQLPLSYHSVSSCLTCSSENLHWTHTSTCCQLHSSMYVLCLCEMK